MLLTYARNDIYRLPPWAIARLSSYCDAVGISSAVINCTYRTAEDQARVMVEGYGTPENAAHLYNGTKGRAVLAAWAANREDPIPAMVAAMAAVGFVSAHMNTNLATVDIDPASVGPQATQALVAYAANRKTWGEVTEVLGPPDDNAIHIALIPPADVAGRVWESIKSATGMSDPNEESGGAGGSGKNLLVLGAGLLAAWWIWG